MQAVQAVAVPTPVVALPASQRTSASARAAFRPACRRPQRQRVLRAVANEAESVSAASTTPSAPPPGFVPAVRPEDLPKGVRKEVRVAGKTVLLFWYRNQIYAIEARSPAEGAYSEGFIKAKFTQDFCIECPGTGSLFSLKDGSIVSWYPNNPVLRMLTPPSTCRPLEIYPVHLGQDAISVDVSGSALGGSPTTRGGSDTSLENNNVYGLEPKVYVEGSPVAEAASAGDSTSVATAATLTVTILAVLGVLVGGSATFYYFFT
ncbi:hypothetical protein CHLNCDRAFT_58270 [Chlorella variabilis]|uniref:Rieske domain-containing protein n=1 Tax=Chlorella variabilis TaxID=554065 RepID=E1ZIN8_CHLVA|nr:hypothetical protein CHLNCDRAFT_58270 [Chlorella variabilis]EFN54367.1 hypothetical protein CHLNCDRAFT_58270 [Chlorella variabilis]|eukprot:XP_005846469.1 hypothetical protein CHLNCDRAFT_58270 [Chlorella variabilis]